MQRIITVNRLMVQCDLTPTLALDTTVHQTERPACLLPGHATQKHNSTGSRAGHSRNPTPSCSSGGAGFFVARPETLTAATGEDA